MYPDLTPPNPVPPLMDTATMRGLLGLTGVEPPTDAQLEFAMLVMSDTIRSYTGRYLSKATYTDKFLAVCPGDIMSLSEFPLESVTSINSPDGNPFSTSRFKVNRRSGILYPSSATGAEVVVEYIAGYDPIPGDLQGVMVELTRRQLQSMGLPSGVVTGDPAIKAVGIGNLRVDYAVSPSSDAATKAYSAVLTDIISQYSGVLDLYRHSRMLGGT